MSWSLQVWLLARILIGEVGIEPADDPPGAVVRGRALDQVARHRAGDLRRRVPGRIRAQADG